MKDPILAEIVALTDALLALARSPNPDLAQAALLLRDRGNLLSILPPPTSEEREARRATILRIQAADAELRARFSERHANIGFELRVLHQRRPHQSRHSHVPRFLDKLA
jgi:hypothetical protein